VQLFVQPISNIYMIIIKYDNKHKTNKNVILEFGKFNELLKKMSK